LIKKQEITNINKKEENGPAVRAIELVNESEDEIDFTEKLSHSLMELKVQQLQQAAKYLHSSYDSPLLTMKLRLVKDENLYNTLLDTGATISTVDLDIVKSKGWMIEPPVNHRCIKLGNGQRIRRIGTVTQLVEIFSPEDDKMYLKTYITLEVMNNRQDFILGLDILHQLFPNNLLLRYCMKPTLFSRPYTFKNGETFPLGTRFPSMTTLTLADASPSICVLSLTGKMNNKLFKPSESRNEPLFTHQHLYNDENTSSDEKENDEHLTSSIPLSSPSLDDSTSNVPHNSSSSASSSSSSCSTDNTLPKINYPQHKIKYNPQSEQHLTREMKPSDEIEFVEILQNGYPDVFTMLANHAEKYINRIMGTLNQVY